MGRRTANAVAGVVAAFGDILDNAVLAAPSMPRLSAGFRLLLGKFAIQDKLSWLRV